MRSLLVLLALGAFLWTAWRSWGYLVDDSFITLRFARNLVEGNGLVYNPGERVEGFTSLSYTLISALLLAMGIEPILGLSVLSGLMAAWALWMTARLERAIVNVPAGEFPISPLLLLSASAFGYWSLRAMETMLFAALLLAALSLSLSEARTKRWRGAALVFGLLALTRPEALLVFGVFTGALALGDGSLRGNWQSLRRHAVNALIFFGIVACLVALRWNYYGELLPNTYYAKVTGDAGELATGLGYLGDFALAFPVFAATLAFPLALLSKTLRARLHKVPALLALHATLFVYVVYIVIVGANFMSYFRFFVAVIPLCAVLAAALIRATPGLATAPVLFGLILIHSAAGLATEQPYRAFVAHRTTVVGERVGAWLGERLEPSDWIAVNTAGSLPYVSRLPTIDMLGLTDPQIARRPIYVVSEGWAGHRRGWGSYVLQRRPHTILWYNSAGLAEPHYLSDRELADNPLFRFFYTMRVHTLPPIPSGAQASALLKRFVGFPFGYDPVGNSAIPELGLALSFSTEPFRETRIREGPIRVVYFEFERRDDDLWEEGVQLERDMEAFVELVAERWAANERPVSDPVARVEVESLCAEALHAIETGDRQRAREILDEAARRNSAAHSPLVPHYIANLAVLSGDLFAAVRAQKEALRLAPGNRLYHDNLLHLLAVPYAQLAGR